MVGADLRAVVAEHPFGIGIDAAAAPAPSRELRILQPRHLHRIVGIDELRQFERQRAALARVKVEKPWPCRAS